MSPLADRHHILFIPAHTRRECKILQLQLLVFTTREISKTPFNMRNVIVLFHPSSSKESRTLSSFDPAVKLMQ